MYSSFINHWGVGVFSLLAREMREGVRVSWDCMDRGCCGDCIGCSEVCVLFTWDLDMVVGKMSGEGVGCGGPCIEVLVLGLWSWMWINCPDDII